MSLKPIVCTVKSPQMLGIGESEFHSGCCTIDVSFPNMGMVDIGNMCFRNSYTAFLSVLCKVKKTTKGESYTKWKVGVDKMKLMPNPHCESKSQALFCLDSSNFLISMKNVCAMRFVLRQPSPCWKSFGLDEIKLYPPLEPHDPSTVIPRWLLAGEDVGLIFDVDDPPPKDQARNSGLPDPDEVSKKLHQLWTLAEASAIAGTITEEAPVGRFDVDGCYEINLLSYT